MPPEVAAWRKQERARLLQARRGLPSTERERLTCAISAQLDLAFSSLGCTSLGIYWPIKGELDLRDWATALSRRRNLQLALPVVVAKSQPLEYWLWRPGDTMVRGFWGILVPEKRDPVVPDVVIAPVVGFQDCYRLGYGGGYFDRTLAALKPRPIAVGIGLESSRVTGFVPQPHDVRMDVLVTEASCERAARAD